MEVDSHTHALWLGKLLANLLSLELMLRASLHEVESHPHSSLESGVDMNAWRVGQEVPLNALTDFDTLGKLVRRYNAQVAKQNRGLVVDKQVVELRDLLVHGRISSPDIDRPFHILKFTQPAADDDFVTVTNSEVMDHAWFRAKIVFVASQIDRVRPSVPAGPPAS